MFVSMFGLKVKEVSINELSVTLVMSDKYGNNITAFFDSVNDITQFSKDIRKAVLNETNKKWIEFDRPTLITD